MLQRVTAIKDNDIRVMHLRDDKNGQRMAEDEARAHKACGYRVRCELVEDVFAYNHLVHIASVS